MLFDTNIFIYAAKGYAEAQQLLLGAQECLISAVTYMEYVPYCRNKRELADFEQLLKALNSRVLDIDPDISMDARRLVKHYALSHSLDMADALIAATAMKYGLVVCTANGKHFQYIDRLRLNIYRPGALPGR